MSDIHSHILWDIDDGSKSKEMTIYMLKKGSIRGIGKICGEFNGEEEII